MESESIQSNKRKSELNESKGTPSIERASIGGLETRIDSLEEKFIERKDRRVMAFFDEVGINVYQAFCPAIAHRAIANGTFGEGFSLHRMTWIKPSFGWMLHRSNYAESKNQEVILQIKMCHQGFLSLLRQSCLAIYDPEVYRSPDNWKKDLKRFPTRIQWDPDRSLTNALIPNQRAIQVGIAAKLVPSYVKDWIIGVTDVTAIAKDIKERRQQGGSRQLSHPFQEREYEVGPEIMIKLGMITSDFVRD